MVKKTDIELTSIWVSTPVTHNVYLTTAAISDIAGNTQVPVHSAVETTAVESDMSVPILNGYDLDMVNGQLVFYFSEAIDFSMVNISGTSCITI